MEKIIITDSSNYKYNIIDDTYKVYEIENIVRYDYINYNSWELILNNKTTVENYYFIADTLYDEAFGHWVIETAIYLPLFNKLKKSIPELKLVLKSEKIYKKLFCNYFGIKDIVYTLNPNNLCFIPSPISALNDNNISDYFKKQIGIFRDCFISSSSLVYELVILPRQIRENYKPNDRKVCFQKLINYSSRLGKRAYILNTDDITTLEDQINIVNSGKNICVAEGTSPFLVNGFFCKDKNIYLVDFTKRDLTYQTMFIKMNFIYEFHKKFNNIICISQTDLIKSLQSTYL